MTNRLIQERKKQLNYQISKAKMEKIINQSAKEFKESDKPADCQA